MTVSWPQSATAARLLAAASWAFSVPAHACDAVVLSPTVLTLDPTLLGDGRITTLHFRSIYQLLTINNTNKGGPNLLPGED